MLSTNRFLTQRPADPTGQRSSLPHTPPRPEFDPRRTQRAARFLIFLRRLTRRPHRSASHASPQPSQPVAESLTLRLGPFRSSRIGRCSFYLDPWFYFFYLFLLAYPNFVDFIVLETLERVEYFGSICFVFLSC